jgi:hypothetical protein
MWSALGPGSSYGPFPADQRRVATCDPLLDAIDYLHSQQNATHVRGNPWPLSLLEGYGFVHAQLSDDGRTLTYRLVKKEPEPDTRSWVEREQAVIDAQVALERQLLKEEEDAREKAASLHKTFERQVHEVVVDLRAQLDEQRTQSDQLRTQADELRTQLAEQRAQISDLQDDVAALIAERQSLQAAIKRRTLRRA